MSRGSVAVPDVVGLTFVTASLVGSAAGLTVSGYAPDGSSVAGDSEGIVVEQDPLPGAVAKAGRHLKLRVGRGDGGSKDPEPRRPDPLVHTDRSEADDSDEDLELMPV